MNGQNAGAAVGSPTLPKTPPLELAVSDLTNEVNSICKLTDRLLEKINVIVEIMPVPQDAPPKGALSQTVVGRITLANSCLRDAISTIDRILEHI